MDIAILTVLNKIGELGNFASKEYSRLKDVDIQVTNLRSKLEFLMAWIQVAEEGNRIKRDQLVSVWVSQLRAAVFDAEDIVDDYIQELCQPGAQSRHPAVEASARRRRRGGSCLPSCFPFHSVDEVAVRHGLSRQIQGVLRRLDEIQKNTLFNMQPRVDALANAVHVFDRPTADTLKCGDPWTLIGLERCTQSIISLLQEDNGKREPIVVVGESGIGKTTAARAVLQSQDVQKRFDVCAWVCLPPKSRVDRYLDLILDQAQEQTHRDCRRSEGVLDKMKLLVVLDGMDSMDELMDVLSELSRGTKGSRIMVTTQLQSKKIEQCIPGIRSVEIKCLKRPDCLQLLSRGLSGNPRRVYDAHKDKFDEKIYNISGGLPLAVVLLRGLVYFKDHEAQWNEVFELLKSFQHKRLIKRILTVSYATMPTVLKLCFLYFAAMPPNAYIDLNKLQRLWSAEGILKSTSRVMGVEEEGCLDILVSRGLVQRVDGGTKLCIHESVHGFAKTMAHETGFMEAHSQFDIPNTSIVRGLSVHNYVDRHVYMENFLPKTRTLLGDFAEDFCVDEAVHPSGSPASSSKGLQNHSRLELLCRSKFLRVLDLQGIQLGKLPGNIGQMIHLRYIGLRSCGLKDLPLSVAKLLNLETLDITDNDIQMVADGFWKIEKLKHVLAKKLSLPVSLASMGLLTNLETLHGVTLCSDGTQENCLLNKMSKLLSLAVVSVTSANVRTLSMALEEISSGLRHLKIAGDCSPVTFPYTRLCSMELDGKALFDEASAQSLNSSYSFTKCRLVLRSSCMSQVLLDTFLSNLLLSELALLDDSFIGTKLLLRKGPFCDLEKLRVGNLKLLEELVIESEMTLLKTIEIFGCPSMKTIQGLKNSEFLTNVVLFDMTEIVAHIKTEDKELFDKIKHVRTDAWEIK